MTAINRPFLSSFAFNGAQFSDTRLEQIHKLIRNFIVSLDLGCPSAKHVTKVGPEEDLSGLDERQKYLAWVKGWKVIYHELSDIIRAHKIYRKTVHFPPLNFSEEELWFKLNPGNNLTASEHLRSLSHKHLERLQESAQVMLNARYNAKLAAAERRRRSLGLVSIKANATVPKTGDLGSSPSLAAE
jgi:hypothetical protein